MGFGWGVGAKPDVDFGLDLKVDGEIVKVVNQGKGEDGCVISKITGHWWILDYREARVEAGGPLRRQVRGDGSLNQGGGSGFGEKWTFSGIFRM